MVEPHRRDSVGRYNRWESTFQTIRRRATVRVIPDASGYVVDVTVEKDLELVTMGPDEGIPGNKFGLDPQFQAFREQSFVILKVSLAGPEQQFSRCALRGNHTV